MSRPSIFAPALGVAAAAADGSVWNVWPSDDDDHDDHDGQGAVATAPLAAANGRVMTRPKAPADTVPWDEMMRRHGRRVIVALAAHGVPLERAKELAQDAWLRVIDRHRAGLIPELSLPGLVITQASFLARDDLRREQRRARLDQPRQQAASHVALDLESQLTAREQLRVVRSVLDRASPNAQRVFGLLYGEHAMSPTQVGIELGLSVQRVRQIVCELRKRMRAALSEPERTKPRRIRR